MEVRPESLKLKKLVESDDIEAYLTTFEGAHEVGKDKWSAPQLTGKALQVFAAVSNEDSKGYNKVKKVIFQQYDMNEETYRPRFRTVKWKQNEAPMEMVTHTKDLAKKWLRERMLP